MKRLTKVPLVSIATPISTAAAVAAPLYTIHLNNELKKAAAKPADTSTPTTTPAPAPTLETYQRVLEIMLYVLISTAILLRVVQKSWNGKNGLARWTGKKMGWIKEAEVVKEEAKELAAVKSEKSTVTPNQPETSAAQKKAEETITKHGIHNGIPIILKGIPRNREQNGYDCGFIALGVERQDAVRWLLAHAHDPRVREMLAPEIQSAVKVGVLPVEMQADPELAVQKRYTDTEGALAIAVTRCKEKLGMTKEAEYSVRQLTHRLANPEPGDQENGNTAFIQEHFGKIYQEAIAAEQAYDAWLPEYCKRQKVFEDYTNYYYEPNGWLNYLPDSVDIQSQGTTIVDAIEAMAREQGKPLRIEIWRERKIGETFSFTLQRQSPHQDGELKRILFVDDNHFIEISEMTDMIKVDRMDAPTVAAAKPAPVPAPVSAPKSPRSHVQRLQQQAEQKEKATPDSLSH